MTARSKTTGKTNHRRWVKKELARIRSSPRRLLWNDLSDGSLTLLLAAMRHVTEHLHRQGYFDGVRGAERVGVEEAWDSILNLTELGYLRLCGEGQSFWFEPVLPKDEAKRRPVWGFKHPRRGEVLV
jgi:hypothetical protein